MDGALPFLSSAVEPMISSESTEEDELENTVLYRNTAAAAVEKDSTIHHGI